MAVYWYIDHTHQSRPQAHVFSLCFYLFTYFFFLLGCFAACFEFLFLGREKLVEEGCGEELGRIESKHII